MSAFTLHDLEKRVQDRARASAEVSYTRKLIDRGIAQCAKKLGEEGVEAAVAALATSGHELVATHPDGDLVPADLAAIPRLALVLGNERTGIVEQLHAACCHSVRIPMRGFAESLNVSVTAAILLQHATSGRAGDLSERERERAFARALVLSVPHAAEILAAKGMKVEVPAGLCDAS